MQSELDGLYISFETATEREHLDRAFPVQTLDRLRRLKEQHDPTELFNANFNIPPLRDIQAAE